MTPPEPPDGTHFIPLAVIMSEYDGRLASYIEATGSRDNVITMPVEMEVAGVKGRKFMVAVAVTWHFDSAEAIQDAAAEEEAAAEFEIQELFDDIGAAGSDEDDDA